MTRRKPRGLRPEEKELWEKVRNSATPLHTNRRRVLEQAVKRTMSRKTKVESPRFRIGEAATAIQPGHAIAPSAGQQLAISPVHMDRKKHQRMTRGKLTPDGRIDLHGMTLTQAHPALIRYLTTAYGAQKRLVLVITGKGKQKPDDGPIPMRVGVLRHHVPMWLNQAPLSHMVMQITEAHAKHGGGGAFYVYLRRNR